MTSVELSGRPPARSFTERVRQELARQLPAGAEDRRALLAAIVSFAGSLHLRGEGELSIGISTRSGAVARAAFLLAQGELAAAGSEARPELEVHAPHGMRSSSRYVVTVADGADVLGRRIGQLDGSGRPVRRPPEDLTMDPGGRRAFLLGAVLTAASFSQPGRRHHLEVVTSNRSVADLLATSIEELTGHRPGISPVGDQHRTVVKSGAVIGRLLEVLGAAAAHAEWLEHRERRVLRRDAIRLANADAANLRRAVAAAQEQVRTVERAVELVGWEGLTPPVRDVALARLANPEATLAELGDLCEPRVGKSAVHRRLARLEEIAAGETGDDEDGDALT
jgi:cell division protein WhiA